MPSQFPRVTRIYQNHHIDSTRWKQYIPRDDDIIISTAYKCGTTWMQNIIRYLILPDADVSKIGQFSPWVGMVWKSLDDTIAKLESQTHRRCIKSHICPDDIHVFWQQWMTHGWFDWESEGYPFWGNLHHTQSYWAYKHLPNIFFVHYNNLLSDTHAQIRQIADYLEVEVSDAYIDEIVELTSFDNMRKHSDILIGERQDFKGGSKAFINKGTNRRWKDVLSQEELTLYDAVIQHIVTPDCAHFLETGEVVS